MIQLSKDIEVLAVRLATAQRLSVEEAIRRALEHEAHGSGLVPARPDRRRMTVEEMLTAGADVAALPLRDPRRVRQIVDDLDAS